MIMHEYLSSCLLFMLIRNLLFHLMAKTCFTSKVHYGGAPGKIAFGKKRKNATTASLFKKMQVRRNGVISLVLEN
ncbi:Uncharacterized protein TCM_025460 [Theobroma cacao]|uniref:Secreted protein n=1 Tax=Theobroma cacao TaxID=3641 RepID=A0A061EZI1_THECC|nr:Uncharacterized protein TCM_025460 [Theobroma cacao]